jgi:hypothetical protein
VRGGRARASPAASATTTPEILALLAALARTSPGEAPSEVTAALWLDIKRIQEGSADGRPPSHRKVRRGHLGPISAC